MLTLIVPLCGGCAVQRGAVNGNYRLFGLYVLPPDAPEQPGDTAEMRVALGALGGAPTEGREEDCAIHDRWFSLYRQRLGGALEWTATVPLVAGWHDPDLISNGMPEWDEFFDEASELQAKGCMSADDYWQATNSISESMPAPVIYSLFFRYSFGTEGYVKLKPGMRLFLERSIYRDEAGDTNSVKNYLGERKVYYDIVPAKGNRLALKRSGVWRSRGLSSRAGMQYPDTGLSGQFEGMSALRLFVLTFFVPPNVHRHSVLIGVRKPEDMVRVTKAIQKRPEVPCSELRAKDVACASFEGVVSASAEVDVIVNGRREYLPIGSTVETALGSIPAEEQEGVLQTLRIERLYRGKYCEVKFNAANPELPKLTLFGGDRISWSRKRAQSGSSPSGEKSAKKTGSLQRQM